MLWLMFLLVSCADQAERDQGGVYAGRRDGYPGWFGYRGLVVEAHSACNLEAAAGTRKEVSDG